MEERFIPFNEDGWAWVAPDIALAPDCVLCDGDHGDAQMLPNGAWLRGGFDPDTQIVSGRVLLYCD